MPFISFFDWLLWSARAILPCLESACWNQLFQLPRFLDVAL